jgi:MFS family permease
MRLLSRIRTFESLSIRDYRLLWCGQFSTSMGQWMDQVARGWLMYEITNSPLQLGLAAAVRGFPLIFFSLAAGVFADRSGRKAQPRWGARARCASCLRSDSALFCLWWYRRRASCD